MMLNYVAVELCYLQDNLITDFIIVIDSSLYNLKFKNTLEII